MFRFQPLALDPARRRRGCVRNILEVLCCRLLLCLLCRLLSQRHSTCRVAFVGVERLPECAAAASSAHAGEVPEVLRNAATSCTSASASAKDLVLNAVLKSVRRKTCSD